MAGKFVEIEDAARLLGVGVEDVKRLVERKKLFPMLDGKFKVDEIERVRASLGDDSSQSGSLALDLPGGDLDLDEPLDLGPADSSADAGSQTIVRGGAPAGGGDALSGLALTDDDDDTVTGGDDLVLEANSGASSPSLARSLGASGSLVGGSVAGGDPLTLDISNISNVSNVANVSVGQGSGSLAGASAAASGFAMPADSGLSLEDGGGLQVSGIDLDTGAALGSGVDMAGGSLAGGSLAGGSFAGDAFDLGEGAGDEDSASVVIATEESGDSSFFENVTDDSASVAIDSSNFDGDSSTVLPIDVPEALIEMGFSGWQIAGLTCCALVLLTGGIVMYDLLSEIHKPQGEPISGLLLNAVGQLMGWRR